MNYRVKQAGFSIVELLLIVVVLGIAGFAGYTVYNRTANKTDAAQTSSETATANDVAPAPQIKSTDDLDKAATQLDQTDTSSSSDSNALDSQLQAF